MDETLAITKAMADETRVRVLMALRGGELCACQLIDLLGLAPSTVSKHMSILRQARLIEIRKAGRWTHYRLTDGATSAEAYAALDWLAAALDKAPQIRDDHRRMKAIQSVPLCDKQPPS